MLPPSIEPPAANETLLNVAPLATNVALPAKALPVPVKFKLYKVLLPAANRGRHAPLAFVITKVDVPAFNVKLVLDKSHNVVPPKGETGPPVIVTVDDPKFNIDVLLVGPAFPELATNAPTDIFTLFVLTVPALMKKTSELVKLS